ncbi:DNA-binding transcriptional regulator GbsR (MarR family) [Caldalkalibacillus uzonensis]|uniref:HTH-type transcriptional regulator n=1 Tax=Caldalkalibacillus uzonensis TaxID=353224 RepID=A0ABU0CXD9_9BACI|nr:GbsR/MarR family transcriptional regulator [Caldalkalibacillus uzonensis]MDQ0340786.1 DNA-binding transcriptional regulator GbsR (MarR family) [Caldalkalibacillus uzonensis]
MQDKQWQHWHDTRQKVIQTISQNMHLFGITPSVGRLYGIMYFEDRPMTLDEMCDALGMSKTSMSTGVRALIEIHMVHKIWQKGVRKDLYQVEEDWYKTFVGLFTTKWRKALESNEQQVQQAYQALSDLYKQTVDEQLKDKIEKDLDKLQHAIEYYDWLKRLVESFESGQIFEWVPKTEGKSAQAER